ncbi:hypothetical protein KAFR_0G03460 [Kazachstania africana CBS 2517]|uniref:Amino acid permease/ SLC12A domain-containing protein n=1 Tax=Kazachstania africana (strain ATCC 22294 / BCRC 22015 / CBS 2517 / CECT 1963 / NBRC 1671 / NRRL Y-8276) TaxID=1071382 RepID=H2AYC8_KAZAF|nr:hypothetical protein KAFR_0G03460 [Kazachstania africana CBS 2517]CCF59378.1 hypothetical protein KAFR_0G03460 [Kazachstania africana CBS 2517]
MGFYDIKGTHRPHASNTEDESVSLLSGSRRHSETYFNYQATPAAQKVSSKYDPTNPNKHKLGTYDGVFVPTALNVLSILMFLRFGFILGQLGIICTMGLLLLSYIINLLTTLSISAISTNGTVRGGGAYYMISRCLGPEFGGSIGLVFFLGQVFNSGMNAIGIVEPILYNLGQNISGGPQAALFPLLPRGEWFEFLYATTILFICIGIALVGSQTVSKAGNILFFVLVASIASVPLSVLFQSPFVEKSIIYTGPSWETLRTNLYPHFTEGAAGSLLKSKETFSSLFGVFFPATAGIFAGAGMSSELRKPSKSIPKGTLWGLLFTFICYAIVVISMSVSIPRDTLHKEVQIIQSVSFIQCIIFCGELATSLFSIIVGMVGASYVLEAISKDAILPSLDIFCKKPIISLLFTWFLTQLCLFSDVNKIASFITMTFLMTFIVMNLACFLLEIAAAPNFRPSFRYFDRYTALFGAITSVIAMIIVDGIIASALMFAMIILFLIIHYFCPPKSWGDVSQSLIYHQVRKYLLRLRQDNIKYWRPQILLFVDNPRTSWNLIKFCNHLKKGGLYILGHVTVCENFQSQFSELKIQRNAWMEIRDLASVKAFVQIAAGPTLLWGIRNVFLGSGLGGMKPNITVIGFYDLKSYRLKDQPVLNNLTASRNPKTNDVQINIPQEQLSSLPTDSCKYEQKIRVEQWVEIIEDLSLMQSNIAIGRGFASLVLPSKNTRGQKKGIIDLYPIQICGTMNGSQEYPSMVTSNFDTYTLILQLGAILVTVPDWKRTHSLRVILFVEREVDRSDEGQRITKLLQVLRIEAEIMVVSLEQFRVYNAIVKGDQTAMEYVNSMLKDNEWWSDLIEARRTLAPRRRFSTSNPVPMNPQHMKIQKSNTTKLQKLGASFKMSSSMPKEGLSTPVISDDSDEDTEQSTLKGSQLSIQQIARKLNHIRSKKEAEERIQGTVKMDKQFHRVKSKHNLKPAFSSLALPNTKVLEDGTGDKPTLVPVLDDQIIESSTGTSSRRKSVQPQLSPCCSQESLVAAMEKLKFDDLPSRAQHLILNDMMTQLSKNSKLIFSTLPVPALGTHKDPAASLDYVEDLDIWLEGLPPTMLINSQTVTVTTAL